MDTLIKIDWCGNYIPNSKGIEGREGPSMERRRNNFLCKRKHRELGFSLLSFKKCSFKIHFDTNIGRGNKEARS